MLKKKRLKLDYSPDIQSNTCYVLGISTSLKPMRLLYFLRKIFQINLVEQKINKDVANEEMDNFFNYRLEINAEKVLLVNNNRNGSFLISKFKPADYLLLFYDLKDLQLITTFKNELKREPSIISIFDLNFDFLTLKEKKHFD